MVRRKKKKKAKKVTQQWQVEENEAYATAAKNLHDLTFNKHVNNESWYINACYEARKNLLCSSKRTFTSASETQSCGFEERP